MRQADAGDFQILSADLLAEGFQRIEAVCSVVIPRKNQPGREYFHLPGEALLGSDLGSWIGAAADFREPAAQ